MQHRMFFVSGCTKALAAAITCKHHAHGNQGHFSFFCKLPLLKAANGIADVQDSIQGHEPLR